MSSQRLPYCLFLCLVKRRADQRAVTPLEVGENLIRRHLAAQQEKSGGPRLKHARGFLHELVVDTEVTELASECAGRRAECCSEKGHYEADEGAQRAPVAAPAAVGS